MKDPKILRKLVVSLAGLMLLIAAALFGWQYTHTGRLVVTTDNQVNTITLKKFNVSSTDGTSLKQTAGRLEASLPVGRYLVIVGGKVLSITQTVEVKARTTKTLRLNPASISNPEAVTSAAAYSISADDQAMYFLKVGAKGLYKIDRQNNLPAQVGSQQIQNVRWADNVYGIGQDDKGSLYLIKNGSIFNFKVPALANKKLTAFSVAPNRQIFLMIGDDIYYGNENSLKKIYTTEAEGAKLVASNDKLAIIKSEDESTEGSGASSANIHSSISVISTQGRLIKKLDLRAFAASWSPDAKKIAITTYDSLGYIYDDSLNLITTLPNRNITTPIWLDNSSLLYSSENSIWTYSLSKGQAAVTASFIIGSTINEIALDKNSQFIYVSVNSDIGGGVKRIGLKGQTANSSVNRLAILLPASVNNCYIDYVNFSGPTVIASPAGNSCLQTARTEVQQDGINLNQLQIR